MSATLDALFARLARSAFRQKFHLGEKEYVYYLARGEETIRKHAADFIAQRLAQAEPRNDGKQTPMRGHPVFIAQHATATCCRGCLQKWHNIQAHQPLTPEQQRYILEVIAYWITREIARRKEPGAGR
ncbi:DUF4186 domain-containing protein [Affinibrenneria salicis]|uniref:DUF4186 domain-containing protein n=1 Tax=Affinibrenneria salicis TaxID=2590031 RepID=A0A5J5G1Z0_9GAMM|nr:DUF4186 domain-containing protein [Affinibrenneria salicis]KAA9000560.1 DUF4186 domain-containing protein [Affinibrenneria salicis]